MKYKITTRTLGAGRDPLAWTDADFICEGKDVDQAIMRGRGMARKKHPKGRAHLVYGAIPVDDTKAELRSKRKARA